VPVDLPLLDSPARHSFSLRVSSPIPDAPALMPGRAPKPGEHYRFHFDMAKCIGCKCCVVACNEQNGNPAEINWRRVGEIEGGIYPEAQRWHVSMGCNHCLEPSCLIGCPVEAYSKDSMTGIVDHDPEICIGCQYCVWNCSYGVPQYNPERGVVGKCDMCHGRLNEGMAPACVSSCPEEAISIEIFDIDAWRKNHLAADSPGLPSSDDSLSTTRLTLPEGLALSAGRVDLERVRPQDPHWSLIFFLVVTQLAVGSVGALWLCDLAGAPLASWAAIVPLVCAAIALVAAPIHLGRPIYAYRAMKNWRRSWISREIVALSLFAVSASAYAGAMSSRLPFTQVFGAVASILGLLGVLSSARIYKVPARPAWNLRFTVSDFLLTCLVLGPRFALVAGLGSGHLLIALAVLGTFAQCTCGITRVATLSRSSVHELRSAAELMREEMRRLLIARHLCAAVSLVLLPFNPIAAILFAIAGEVLNRYLFFAAVVPKSVASTYLTPKEAAA
jgi:formate dehydrogenase iron-sulfur subunit